MRVAVTGGSGFIGSHVVDHLAAAGHEVTVIDRRPPHRADVAHADVDINDVSGLVVALAGVEVVFHLAAYADVNDVAAEPVGAIEANVLATTKVWEACRQVGVRRAILASTVWVYGITPPTDGELDEDAPFAPSLADHLYTSSKVAAELVVQSYETMFGQEFTILRYGIPYGPRMRPSLVISKFTAMALADEPITVHGDGSQHRNYVYVEDLAAAHVLALRDVAANQTFNLEGSEQVTVRALVASIEHALDRPVQVQFGDARVGDYQGAPISAARAADVLGWRPRVPFEEGLRRYVDWYTNEGGVDPAQAPVVPSSTASVRDVIAALAAAVVLLPALAVTSRSGAGWAAGAASAAVAGCALLGARWRRVHLPPLVALATAVVATWLVSQAGTRIDGIAVGALLGVGLVGLVPERRWSQSQTAALAAGALALTAVRVLDASALFWAAGAMVVATGAVVMWPARGAPALVHRPPRRGWAVGVVTASAVLASWFGATSATATWFGPVTAHGSRSTPTVALTIDGDLTAASARAALATLGSANATATFFVSATWIEQQRDIARTIIARGDLLATLGSNRSWTATRSRLLTDSRATFGSSVGVCPRYFRPANGVHTPLLALAARAVGMRVVTWDIAPPTIGARRVQAIVDDVARDGRPGSIIVLRLPEPGAADVHAIAGTLAGVLHGLRRHGLEPVRLDDLLGTRGDVVSCKR